MNKLCAASRTKLTYIMMNKRQQIRKNMLHESIHMKFKNRSNKLSCLKWLLLGRWIHAWQCTPRGFWDSGDNVFLDLGGGSTGIFTL